MEQLLALVQTEKLLAFVRAAILVIAGLVAGKALAGGVGRLLAQRLAVHETKLFRRVVFYAVLGLFLASALHELGFSLTALLGAAGIVSVALGFAAQTSVSNMISGLFLMAEKPFAVGDVIKAGDTTGEVLAIDLLSVKIRTFDNLYVRIPNETLLKSATTTLTRFPIRRIDLKLGVAYKEDLKRVREILFELASSNPLCLEEPKPLFIFLGFGESSLDLQFSVWVQRDNVLELKNGLQEKIKESFDREGIEIPFPQRSIHAGATTQPLPVRVVPEPGEPRPPVQD